MNMMRKYRWVIAGIVFGGLAGFLYWNFVGCSSGQCAITSVWYRSTVYGSILGGLLVSTVSKTSRDNN